MTGDVRKRRDYVLFAFGLGVEDAERIGVDSALGIGAKLVFYFSQRGFELRDVAAAAIFGVVADGVDVERCAVQADLVKVGHQHFDDFGVDGGSVGATK